MVDLISGSDFWLIVVLYKNRSGVCCLVCRGSLVGDIRVFPAGF